MDPTQKAELAHELQADWDSRIDYQLIGEYNIFAPGPQHDGQQDQGLQYQGQQHQGLQYPSQQYQGQQYQPQQYQEQQIQVQQYEAQAAREAQAYEYQAAYEAQQGIEQPMIIHTTAHWFWQCHLCGHTNDLPDVVRDFWRSWPSVLQMQHPCLNPNPHPAAPASLAAAAASSSSSSATTIIQQHTATSNPAPIVTITTPMAPTTTRTTSTILPPISTPIDRTDTNPNICAHTRCPWCIDLNESHEPIRFASGAGLTSQQHEQFWGWRFWAERYGLRSGEVAGAEYEAFCGFWFGGVPPPLPPTGEQGVV